MTTHRLHRGRLIDHLQLVVRDLDASKKLHGRVGSFADSDGWRRAWIFLV